MDDKKLDRMIDEALEIPIPEGLAERLEQHVDHMAVNEKKHKLRRSIYWTTSIAAIILFCVGIFIGINNQVDQYELTDTYTDPAEAAIVAEKALAFMSVQLNKGLDQVNNAGEEIEKVNQIVYKHLSKE